MATLVVALDVPDRQAALGLARRLHGVVPWLKVGLELFVAAGPGIVTELRNQGFRVFLDLKFHDIPNTVHGAVRSATALGADMLTVHAMGGAAMLAAAVQGRKDGGHALLVAVTVLTSLGRDDLGIFAVPDPQSLATALARTALAAGLDGVVCSAFEVPAVKALGPALCVTPGIRMAEAAGDQKRVAHPALAVAGGADFLVVGRPIAAAADPAAAARSYLEAMNQDPRGLP